MAILVGVAVVLTRPTAADRLVELTRDVGSPAPARMLAEPGSTSRYAPEALAFGDEVGLVDVLTTALGVAEIDRYAPIRLAPNDRIRVVCDGHERPTLDHDRLSVETLRLSFATGVTDVRVTEFSTTDEVAAVLADARGAYTACERSEAADGRTVARSVIPFVSLAGSDGLTLVSSLVEPERTVATSQTVSVARGRYLIEVRTTVSGDLPGAGAPDPVVLLDAVEGSL